MGLKMSKRSRPRWNRSLGGNICVFTFVGVFAVAMVLPLIYAISSSLKPLNELWYFPPRFLVANPTAKNYKDLLYLMNDSWVPFTRYLFNTLFVAILGTAGHVVLASMCAYVFSKHQFLGRNTMFNMVVLSLMFSSAVTGIPSYIIMSQLHLTNTYFAIILPAFSSTLGLYLMKQFMGTNVPDVIIEAARIDGSGEVRLFWKIIMPMVKPAWLTLIVFSFQNLWNATGGIYIQSEQIKSLNYAISQIVSGGIARAGASAASIVVMMALPILVFFFTQSNIVETMSSSGIKE
ncbi:MAG: carbohydrate ABC transporter permease [Oscillospiraceae bacterium]|nr:carbohydrate ABC transporter permease [Oscillospiraceae bacterium]